MVTDVLDAVLEVVKVVGSGAAGGLPGLMAMYEDSELMRALKAAGGAAPDYAVHADFEPHGSLASMMWLPDTMIDRVFADAANDIAVPCAGVGFLDGVPVPTSPCPGAARRRPRVALLLLRRPVHEGGAARMAGRLK